MRIKPVNNLSFKSAYIISGKNKSVKIAKKYLDEVKQTENLKYIRLGTDPYDDKLPGYLLVTTGEDVAIYDEFAKKAKYYYALNADLHPDNLSKRDFTSKKAYERHAYMSAALNEIDTIQAKCRFTTPIGRINAGRAAQAMGAGNFNYQKGKIE